MGYNEAMELTIDTPIRFVPHIGPIMAGRLANLDIFTVQDLLYHVPFRYNDFTQVLPIAAVKPKETVTVSGVIESIKNFVTKTGKKVQDATISDESGRLHAIWFNQVYLLKVLHPGDHIHLSGKIDWFGSRLVMSNPQYEIRTSLHTGRLVPVYPETEGVTSKWLRGRIAFLLDSVKLSDFMPENIQAKHQLMNLPAALRAVHYPDNKEDIEKGRHRIAFDEVFLLQLKAHEQKRLWRESQKATAFKGSTKEFVDSLPFTLTNDQKKALSEIVSDIKETVPMNRLLVGDVGSGKTVVAAAAMYIVNKKGYHAVLMAPTQILAHQHYQTLHAILSPFGITVGQVTAQTKEKADVLVGTHALLSTGLPKKTGLVVVDEQHRFGVAQRAKLAEGKVSPHFLTMTATPIPRTIAKTLLGNVDLSVLEEMPKGRRIVKTWVVSPEKRKSAYEWIKKQPGQAFIICPFIEASDTMTEVKAVKEEYAKVKKIFSRVGLLHGKMKAAEKTKVLDDFKAKKYSVLVATPVVEVGIDIPNATIMVIEGADRFGLGQLHQLRGRVGRGTMQSYCLLFTEIPEAVERLKNLEHIHSGPRLAQVDLMLRGPGEVFGMRQHGVPHLKIASFTDMETINETEHAIKELSDSALRELTKKIIIDDIRKD